MGSLVKKAQKALQTVMNRRKTPLRVEFNLTDFCNLNCKGCSHYSPLAEREFQPPEQLEESMKKVSGAKNAGLLQDIYLIGGETLLYPEIKEAMVMARKYFPDAKISLFTNGLLIPKLDDEFWKICKETSIVMAITRYPVRFDYDKVEEICRNQGVKSEIFGDRSLKDSFFKLPLDPSKKQNGWMSHFRCISFGCVTVDGGRIFPCSQSACVGHLNRRFGTDFQWKEGDFIEVEKLKDIKEIKRLRDRPVPFCKYCRHQVFTDYGPSKRLKEEWM